MRGERFRSLLRAHRFGVSAIVFAFVIKLWLFLSDPMARYAVGDGHYNYLFTRSLVMDHDIEFTNDYKLCFDPWNIGVDRGTGHPDNKFYSGPSLFWVPVLTVVKAIYPLGDNPSETDKGACWKSPWVSIVVATTLFVGLTSLAFCYLMARRFASDGVAAMATLLMGLGTPHLAFSVVFVSYSMAYCELAVVLHVWTTMRVVERWTWGRWLAVAATAGLCGAQRLPLIGYGLVGFVVALDQFRRERRLNHLLAIMAMLAGGALIGLLPTFAVYKYLYGNLSTIPQGRHYIHFSHAHPFLLLFGTHGGLFFQSPIVWLSVAGLPLLRAQRRLHAFFAALIVAMLVDLWISSSSLDYHGAWTFGARRLVTFMPLFVMSAAMALDWIARWLSAREGRALRVLGVTSTLVLGVTYASWVFAYVKVKLQAVTYLTQAEGYGAGPVAMLEALDKTGIYPAVLPGQLWFWARYRTPLTGYGPAIEPIFRRDQVTLVTTMDVLPVTADTFMRQTRGFTQSPQGVQIEERQGRVVFSAEWPYATHYAFKASAQRDCKVRVGRGGWFNGASFFETVQVKPGAAQSFKVKMAAGSFGSGLNELVIEQQDPACKVRIEELRIIDENTYPPAFDPPPARAAR